MVIWVVNYYPFDENPHKEGKHGKLYYQKGTADVGKLFSKTMEQKRGKLLIAGTHHSKKSSSLTKLSESPPQPFCVIRCECW